MNHPTLLRSSRARCSPLRIFLAASIVLPLAGCAHAPSFNVLGSYFPGWIACIVLSVVLTSLLRVFMDRMRWEAKLPALPLFYFSIAILIACSLWLIAFE